MNPRNADLNDLKNQNLRNKEEKSVPTHWVVFQGPSIFNSEKQLSDSKTNLKTNLKTFEKNKEKDKEIKEKEIFKKEQEKETWIYELELVKGKYYVGSTNNVTKRYQQHLTADLKSKEGCVWTSVYPPLKLLNSWLQKMPDEENRRTEELMLQKGISNVRGGIYVQITLPFHQRKTLIEKIRHQTRSCFRCGNKGHWALQCSF